MHVINIKKLLNNKLTMLIFSIVSIVILLSIIIYTLSMKSNILRGTKIGDILGRLGQNNNILNMESYYAEFEVTIISNKNTNTYFMKEWYKKSVGNRIEWIDSEKSKTYLVVANDKMVIKNNNQKNTMITAPYLTSYTNVISITTFINIYNENFKKPCCFNANSYEKVNDINMILDNICRMRESCDCNEAQIVKMVSKMELKLNKNTGIPITYIVYDNDKKESISIVYNKFDINTDIPNSTFEV